MTSTLTFFAAVILLFQGASILMQATLPPHLRRFGLLTVSLALTGILGHALFTSGALVLSPEFGIIMVQGELARLGLRVLIFGFALQLAYGWAIVRMAAGWPSRIQSLLLIGGAVGLFSALRLPALNPEDLEAFRIYAYDLWLPPLLLWFCASFMESGFTLLRVKSLLLRAGALSLFLAGICVWVMHQPELLHDAWAAAIWTGCLYIVFPLSAAPATILIFKALNIDMARPWRGLKILAALLWAGFGVYSAHYFLSAKAKHPEFIDRIISTLLPFAFWMGWLLLFLIIAGARYLYSRLKERRTGKAAQKSTSLLAKLIFINLLLIAASLVGVFYEVASVPTGIALLSFFIAWAVLTELVTDGILHEVYAFMRTGKAFAADSRARKSWSTTWKGLTQIGAMMGKLFLGIFRMSSPAVAIIKTLVFIIFLIAFSEVFNAGKTVIQPFTAPGAKSLEGYSEALSDRVLKEIGLMSQALRPEVMIPTSLDAAGSKTEKIVPLGENLNSLNATLAKNSDIPIYGEFKLPISVLVEPLQRPMRALLGVRVISGSFHKKLGGYKVLASSSNGENWTAEMPEASSTRPERSVRLNADTLMARLVNQIPSDLKELESAFKAISSDLQMMTNGVTESTDAFLALKRGLRAIDKYEAGHPDSLIAAISWFREATLKDPNFALAHRCLGLALMRAGHGEAAAAAFRTSMQTLYRSQPEDTLSILAKELAFKIVSTDPNMIAMGMTKSWEAYQLFESGLKAMEKFESGNFDSLTSAIRWFQRATVDDPKFALAFYRLGLALQYDGQPAAATEAFRSSLSANPNFIAGYNALAYHLHYFDNYYYTAAAPVKTRPLYSAKADTAYANEARQLWQRIMLFRRQKVYLPTRASAFHGLCLNAFWSDHFPAAYFYGQRAARLYHKLQEEHPSKDQQQITQAQASVLNLIGISLEHYRSREDTLCFHRAEKAKLWSHQARDATRCYGMADTIAADTPDWFHSAHLIVEDSILETQGKITKLKVRQSPYGRAALRYYDRAQALAPADPHIRGNGAIAAFNLGDSTRMKELRDEASARLKLAEQYRERAKRKTNADSVLARCYFRRALWEYEAAIALDPHNLNALNGYAYTFWVWRLHWPKEQPPHGPDAEIALTAEKYSRRAIKLSVGKPKHEQAIYRSTLGEVLLGQGRTLEAIEILSEAFEKTPSHHAYDEIRWDLAQACMTFVGKHRECCLSLQKNARDLSNLATVLLEQIRENERTLEFQPFTSHSSLLDASKPLAINIELMQAPVTVDRPIFALNSEKTDYRGRIMSNWLGVTCEVDDWAKSFEGRALVLHVWGGGIDNRIWANEDRYDNVFLSSKPSTTHDYYFAQLEEAIIDEMTKDILGFVPVSPAQSIQTTENPDYNYITLVYERVR